MAVERISVSRVAIFVDCAALTVLRSVVGRDQGLRNLAKPRLLHPWLSCAVPLGLVEGFVLAREVICQ